MDMRKVALIAAALLALTPLQAATRRHIAGRAGADPVFGVFVNVAARPDSEQIGRAFDLAQADGIGWVRIPFTWSTIQPNPSVTNLNLYYPLIARAKQDNLRIIGVLGYSTPWNTTAPASETPEAMTPEAMAPRARLQRCLDGQSAAVGRYYDKLVEIRNLNPAFVAAVNQIQQARAAQYAAMQAPAIPPLQPGPI